VGLKELDGDTVGLTVVVGVGGIAHVVRLHEPPDAYSGWNGLWNVMVVGRSE
jgi:hypothetical protein